MPENQTAFATNHPRKIRFAVDEIETKLDQLIAAGGGGGDASEATLTEVRDNLAQIEGYVDGLEAALDLVANRFSPSQGEAVTVSASGPTDVYTPASGQRVRLKWVGLSTSENNGAETIVTVKLGDVECYKWAMGVPGAFAHGVVREGGVDESLTVVLSNAQTVYVNFDVEEF